MASKKSEYPVANEAMSLEESFHNCFLYFMEAVDVLSLDAAEQCEAMGNFNVAWEIQHDVFDGGTSLINWPIDYLSPSEKDAIAHVITPLEGLSDGALLSDNLRAMSHPSWADLRIAAKRLRVQLDDAVKKNCKFFDNQRLQR